MASKSGVKVKLDRVRTLRYTNRAVEALEDELGLSLLEALGRVGAGSVKTINRLVWAGLLHADPDLTPDEVIDMVDLSRIEEVGDAVAEAVEHALGKPEPAKGKAEPEPEET